MRGTEPRPTEIPEPRLAWLFFADTRIVWFWLLLRLHVGYVWSHAAADKPGNPSWTGAPTGTGRKGFLPGAIGHATGTDPAVQGWYAAFLQQFVLQHPVVFSYKVALGELAVGIACVLGIVTGIAHFFGCFMQMNSMPAGSASVHPLLCVPGLFLVLAWRVAGWYGADRYAPPVVGTPWKLGSVFTGCGGRVRALRVA
jgi:thiosulfate dehydrogenase [quinone] large subunit